MIRKIKHIILLTFFISLLYTANFSFAKNVTNNSTINSEETFKMKNEAQITNTSTKKEEKIKSLGVQAIEISAINEKGEQSIVSINPNFDSKIYEYSCNIAKDITKLSVKVDNNSEDMKIEILGNEDIQFGENVITIIAKDENTNENLTYQIIVEKNEKNENTLKLLNDNQKRNAKILLIKKIVFITNISIITIAGILFGIIEYRHTKQKNVQDILSKKIYDKEEIINEDNLKEQQNKEEKDEKIKLKGKHF